MIEHSKALKRLAFDATIHCHATTPNWRFILGFLVENRTNIDVLELSPIPIVTVSNQEILTKGFSKVDINSSITLDSRADYPVARKAEELELHLDEYGKWSESPLLLSLCTDVAISSFGLREFPLLKKLVLTMPSADYMPQQLLSMLENSNLPIMLRFYNPSEDSTTEASTTQEMADAPEQ